jgi:hypothetical protein
MSFYRCAVCNVLSKGLIAHDKHLSGKRHQRNMEKAASAHAPAKRKANNSQRHSSGPSSSIVSDALSARAAKRQRQQKRDTQAVDRIRAMLQQEEATSSLKLYVEQHLPSSKPFSEMLLSNVFPFINSPEPPSSLVADISPFAAPRRALDTPYKFVDYFQSEEEYLKRQRGLILEEVRFTIYNTAERSKLFS